MKRRKVIKTPALTWTNQEESIVPPVNPYLKKFDRVTKQVGVNGILFYVIFQRNGQKNQALKDCGPVTELVNIYQFYKDDTTILTMTIKDIKGHAVEQYARRGSELVLIYNRSV